MRVRNGEYDRMVGAYHSGGKRQAKGTVFLIAVGDLILPRHPAPEDHSWYYWKEIPLSAIAVNVPKAYAEIAKFGFYIQ